MLNSRKRFSCMSLIMGVFLGIIIVIGSVFGGAYYAYNNMTLQKLEALTKIQIPLGDDPENLKTMNLKDLFKFTVDFAKDAKNLTVEKIEKTFGLSSYIPNEFMGLDITDLKKVPLNELQNNLTKVVDKVNLNWIKTQFNVTLPDIPFLSSREYVLATGEDFKLLDAYKKSLELFTRVENPPEKEGDPITYTYTLALKQTADGKIELDKDGNVILLPSIPDNTPIYSYELSLLEQPITKALNGFSAVLDMSKLTFGDLQTKFGINFNDVSMLEKLKGEKIAELGTAITSIFDKITISELQKDFGITLPDLPFISGSETNPAYTYIEATDATFILKEFYANLFTDEKEKPNFFVKDGENYVPYTNQTGVAIFYRANGLTKLPIKDAFNGMGASLDMNKLTFRDLESKLGISFKQPDGTYNTIFKQLLDKKIGDMGTALNSLFDTITLAELQKDFSITLPDLPFISGGEAGKEIYAYVEATDATFKLKEFYANLFTDTTKPEEKANFFVKNGENYIPYTNQTGVAIFYRANGLTKLPIKDAFAGMGTALDMKTLTFGDLETKLGISLKQDGKYPVIIEQLLDKKVSELGNVFTEVFDTISLETLQKDFGITLPDLPFISGGAVGSEIYSYTLATDATFTLKEFYAKRFKEESEKANFFIKEGETYKPYTNQKNVPIYYRANGLLKLPVKDAFAGMGEALDMKSLTFRELESKLGISFKQADGTYNPIFEQLLDKKIGNIGSEMGDVINSLNLRDVIDMKNQTGIIASLEFKKGDAKTILLPGESLGLDGFIYFEKDGVKEKVPTKITELSSQINYRTVGDVLGAPAVGESAFMTELRTAKIGELSTFLDGLELRTILGVTDPTDILYKITVDPTDPTKGLTLANANLIGGNIKILTVDDVLGKATGVESAFMTELRKAKIGELSTFLDGLELRTVLGVTDPTDILYKITADPKDPTKGLTLKNASLISGNIKILTVGDVLGAPEPGESAFMTELRTTKIGDLSNTINTMSLRTILGVTDPTDILYKITADPKDPTKGLTLANASLISGNIKTLTVGDVLGTATGTETAFMLELRKTKIGDLSTTINTMSLRTILGVTDTTDILWKITADPNDNTKGLTLANASSISGNIKTLTVGDVLGTATGTETAFMNELRKTKIGDLSTTINTMSLRTILGVTNPDDLLFKITASKDPLDKNGLTLANASLISGNIQTLKLSDLIKIPQDSAGKPIGIWNYIPADTQIDGLGTAIAGVGAELMSATLGQLCDNGILTGITKAELVKAGLDTLTLPGVIQEVIRLKAIVDALPVIPPRP